MANVYTFPNATTGIDDVLVQTATAVDIFIPMLLFFIYMVVFLGGIISQRRTTGRGDAPMWALMASITILLLALIMTLVAGLIQIEVLAIIGAVTIMTGLWFFMDKNRYEGV